MKYSIALVAALACVLTSVVRAAEENPLRWRAHEGTANTISNVLVGTQLGAHLWTAWRADDKKHAGLELLCENVLASGTTEILKHVVHRTRPDGSDRLSWPSGHTTSLVVNGGWKVGVSIPIAIGGAAAKLAGNRHYPSDLAGGAAVALLAQWVCRW